MDEILKQIHYYAQQLKGINMWQAAGDYDYISSFLDSPRWNDGEYYGVVPRGEETVDEYSHNCPIPFTANRCLVSRCYNNDKALEILSKLSEIFSTLKSDVSGDGLTAINAYIENTNLYIELLGGEPVPPGPEPPVYDTYYAGGIISPDASIDFVVTKPDKTFFTVDNISLYNTSSNISSVYTVDNISLTGFMIPMSVENTVYGNQTTTPKNIVINDNDVDVMLYVADGQPITDQSNLYSVKRLFGTGNGGVPATVTADGFPTSAGDTNEDMQFHPYGSYLYDSTGNKIYVGNNATVINAKVFLKNGNDVTYQLSKLIIYNGYLYLFWSSNYTWLGAYKITYTVDMVQSFTDLDTLRKMGFVSTYFDSQDLLRLKFSCAGTGVTFTGAMDSVTVIATVKQKMIVNNIWLHGMTGPMGGMITEYVPPVVLPTVTTLYLNPSHTAVEVVDTGLFGAGYTLYYENGDTYSESTIPMLGAAFGQNVQWSPFDVSNRFELVLRNNKVVLDGKGAYSSYVQRIEICADTDTTVITVYNSSNNPYNAFKYSLDSTDYYYVLDGTQTDWTDDLSGIGYSLQQIYTAYFSDQGESGSNVTYSGTSRLYDASGNLLYYDSTKSYTLITGYLKNGTENNPNEWGVQCYFTQQDTSLHTLGLFLNEAFTFYKILYLMERLPAPDLPTVNTAGFIMPGHAVTINAGTTSTGWYVGSTGQPFVYESTKSYGVGRAMDDIGGNDIDPTVFALVDSSGELAVKNISNSPVNVGVIYVSICSSPNTTVVTVYDSSNNPYNAFKYTSDGTDYYYVLDGVQTDWTDDLASIGYKLDYIDVIVGIRWDPSTQTWLSKTFSGSSDWWWCGVINQSDISKLNNFGVGIITKSDASSQWNGTIGAVAYNPDFDYTIKEFYSDFGETPVAYNLNDFLIVRKSTTSSGNYDLSCLIHSVYATSESVKSYKLRIKPGGNRNSCLFTTYSGNFISDQWYPLYKSDGSAIEYTGVPTNVIGYFDFNTSGYDAISFIPSGYTISFRNNDGFLEFKQSNQLSQSLNSVYALIVIWSV